MCRVLLPVLALGLQPGDTVLDSVCSPWGGKDISVASGTGCCRKSGGLCLEQEGLPLPPPPSSFLPPFLLLPPPPSSPLLPPSQGLTEDAELFGPGQVG